MNRLGSQRDAAASRSLAEAGIDTIRIGLLWHSVSSGNLGVGALTLGNIALVRDVAGRMGLRPEFVVMGMRDGDSTRLLEGEVETFVIDSRSLISPGGFWRALASIDCVLDIGAGDSFAEIYGARRFGFLWLTKMLAIARGVPLVLSPQTIGPFTHPVYRRLGAMALRQSAAVLARDQQSLDVARAMAPRSRTELAVDVAFVLPFVDRSAERGGAKLRVGVNASGLLFHQAETKANRFGLSYDYAVFTRRLLDELTARDDVEVHLVPHATSGGDPTDDDERLALRLAEEFPAAVLIRAIEVDGDLIDGPGRLCRALQIDRSLNRLDLTIQESLWFEERGDRLPRRLVSAFPRIGVDYAGDWAKKPWRFRLDIPKPSRERGGKKTRL